jgi:hypothetical protein
MKKERSQLEQSLLEVCKNVQRGEARPDLDTFWILATLQEHDDIHRDLQGYDDISCDQLEVWQGLGGRLELLRVANPADDWVANRLVIEPWKEEAVGISFPSRGGQRGFVCVPAKEASRDRVRALLQERRARLKSLRFGIENLLVWMPTVIVINPPDDEVDGLRQRFFQAQCDAERHAIRSSPRKRVTG